MDLLNSVEVIRKHTVGQRNTVQKKRKSIPLSVLHAGSCLDCGPQADGLLIQWLTGAEENFRLGGTNETMGK